MAFSLAGLGQIGSAAAGDMPQAELRWQEVLQGRQRLQEQQRQQQAQRAFIESLLTPAEGALPQQGPPGMSGPPPTQAALPQLQTQPAPMGIRPTDAALSAPGGTTPPATAQPPVTAGGPAPAPPVPGGGGINLPDPLVKLRQMAQALKRASPQADNATLYDMLQTQIGTIERMAPQDKILMQAQVSLMKAQEDWYKFNQADVTKRRGQDIGAQSRMNVAQAMIGARQALQAGQTPDEDTLQVIAEQRSYGDTSVMSLGWSGAIRTKIMGMAAQIARARGSSLAAEDANYRGISAGAGVIGRTAGSVAVGAEEIPALVPLILETARRLNTTQYPTINAVELAYKRGIGDPDVVRLASYIQTIRNAYQQVGARGGRLTDQQRTYAEALISGNMPVNQLAAAASAMVTEAGVVKGATGAAMKSITGGLGQRGGTQPAGDAGMQGGPAVGTVQDGYRFKGGNPADQSSWEKVR